MGLGKRVSMKEEDVVPSKPAFGMSMLDRYWSVNTVLGLTNLSLKLRMIFSEKMIKRLRELHEKEVAVGAVALHSVVLDQQLEVLWMDKGSMCSATEGSREQFKDMFLLGVCWLQMLIHEELAFEGVEPSKPQTIEKHEYEKLAQVYAKEMQNEDLEEGMADSFEFIEGLEAEVRGLLAKKKGDDITDDAINSWVELIVQLCSVLRDNRPDSEGCLDWFQSVMDDATINGPDDIENQKLMELIMNGSEDIFDDIFDDVLMCKDSSLLSPDSHEDRLSQMTNDSFQPPRDGTIYEGGGPPKERRKSKLSMFIVEEEEVAEEEDIAPLVKVAPKSKWSGKKKQRLSIKPSNTTMNMFRQVMGSGKNASDDSKVVSPEYVAKKFDIQERLTSEEAIALLAAAEKVFRSEANLVTVQAPATCVGDIHGQYFDLRNLMKLGGSPIRQKYIFLGDYVDRGDWSCEVLFYLLALKVAYPQNMTMIRGNHECDAVSSYFGFKTECEQKYGPIVFHKCLLAFQAMPVGALLETGGTARFLCLHGGISPNVTSLSQFDELDRFKEPGMNGFLCDVVWADPINDDFNNGEDQSLGDFLAIDFVSNASRGCSYRYVYCVFRVVIVVVALLNYNFTTWR